MYTLQQGPTEKTILEQCYLTGMPVPDVIANAPELDYGLSFYYDAFLELSGNRQIAYSECPIKLLEILDYCGYYDIQGELQSDLVYHIRSMDHEYLSYRASQSKK